MIDLGIEHLSDVELIGRGGFSTVYAATDERFDRRVAVKLLGKLHTDKDRQRFERECKVMGRLSSHPNVVTVFDAGYSNDNSPYLIMELVSGGSMADRLQKFGALPATRAVEYLIPIADALGHGHSQGILHRDVKPENILMAGDQPRLTDFGIASVRDSTGATSTNITASWLHTAPETFANQRDERSDLYSLVSTLHTLIVGNAPFWVPTDESLSPLMYRLLHQAPPRLPVELASPALADLVVRGLAKDPADRPQNAAALIDEMRRVLGSPNSPSTSEATRAVPVSPLPAPPRAATISGPPPPQGFAAPPPPRQFTSPPPPPQGFAAPPPGYGTAPGGYQTPTGQTPTGGHTPDPQGFAAPAPGYGTAPGGYQTPGSVGQYVGATGSGPIRPGRQRSGPQVALLVGLAVFLVGALVIALALAANGGGTGSDTTTATGGQISTGTVGTVLTYSGHTDWVRALAVLDDGRIASGSDDTQVHVWDPANPEASAEVFTGHTDWLRAAAPLSDGRVATGGDDLTVQVWDPDQLTVPPVVFSGHPYWVNAVAELPDGRIAAASQSQVFLWNSASPTTVPATFDGQTDWIRSITVLDDGRVATGSDDGAVYVWDPDNLTASPIVLSGSTNAVLAIATLPDGRLAWSGGNAVYVWDVDDSSATQVTFTQHSGTVQALTALPDGRLVSASDDGAVLVWSPENPTATAIAYTGHDGIVYALDHLADGRVVSGGDDDTVQVWNPDSF